MESTVETRILNAAFKVINEHSISGTRMHLIAQECGMAQSNLHYHFKTKKDLLIALNEHIQKTFDETRAAARPQYPQTLRGQLRGYFDEKKNLILHKPEYERVQMDYWNLGQIDMGINDSLARSYSVWRSDISATILRFEPDMDPAKADLAAHIMVSMMFGAAIQYLCDDSFNLDNFFEVCLAMVENFLHMP